MQLLGATPAEQRLLADARDRAEESRRARPAPSRATSKMVPRQLPADVFGFVGRAEHLTRLDYAHHQAGQYRQAIDCYRHALTLLRDRFHEAEIADRLGDAHLAVGDRDAARAAWNDAMTTFDEFDPAKATAVRAKLDALTD